MILPLSVAVDIAIERDLARQRDRAPAIAPPPVIEFVTAKLMAGGAQILTLRWLDALPAWAEMFARLRVQCPISETWKGTPHLLDATHAPEATHTVLSAASLTEDLELASTTVAVLHSVDPNQHEALYGGLYGARVVSVAKAVQRAHGDWIQDHQCHDYGVEYPRTGVGSFTSSPRATVNGCHMLFVGRPVEAKGAHLMVPTLRELQRRGTKASLTFVIPEGFKDFEDSVTAAKFTGDGVILIVNPEATSARFWEFSDRYQFGNVLVLPSQTEGMPLVVGEALACGLSVVATDVGGIREWVTPGTNGMLLPVEDLTARLLATAVESTAHPGACWDGGPRSDGLWNALDLNLVPGGVDAEVTVRMAVGAESLPALQAACGALGGQTFRSFITTAFPYEVDGCWPVCCPWTEFILDIDDRVRLERHALERAVGIMKTLGVAVLEMPLADGAGTVIMTRRGRNAGSKGFTDTFHTYGVRTGASHER